MRTHRVVPALLTFSLLACQRETDDTGPPGPGTGGVPDDVLPSDSGSYADTADTARAGVDTAPPAQDCAALPTVADVTEIDISTEEDFDFDHLGYLVYQQGSDLVGRKYDGSFEVISPGVSTDAAGVQTLGDGNLVVASPDTGGIMSVNRATGANNLLIGGLSSPNGLEVGPGDTVYFTEYFGSRVRWIDPATGDTGEIANNVELPNGLAFAPDSQSLYVTANGAGTEGILKYSRTADGFDDGVLFMAGASGDYFDSVETDICGNVYTVEYSSGNVFRITPDGLVRELIADLSDSGFEEYASIKWGNDIDVFTSDTLYVTNRNHIFALAVGIQGSPDVLPPF